MKQIILASASPRRKEILEITGLRFKVDPGDYEENMVQEMEPHRLARLLSVEKAKSVAPRYRNAIIISADTFIAFHGKFLGKPHTTEEAVRMLKKLNGKVHSVITGYTVLDTGTGKRISRSVETRVWFKRLTEEEIKVYVKTKEPLDKAGAYAIQGLGALLVKKIDGDYLNVVGLPLFDLMQTLLKFGVKIL